MMKFRRLPVYMIAFCLLAITTVVAYAQDVCEVLAQEAFENMRENCEAADGQTACYGFDSLSATFAGEVDSDIFSDPSDLIDLFEIHTVRTQAFDEEEEEWGISYFRIPIEGSDQPLVIIMAGDVIVENALDPESPNGMSPMQVFNFETGGESDCTDAPNKVFIQAPQGLEVDLQVNSTPIRIGSTIVLGTDANEDGEQLMYFGVLEGHLVTNPGTPEEQTVPEGNVTTVEIAPVEFDGELEPVIDPVTGEPVIGPNGEPFYRRVPVADFTEPQPITVDGEGYLGWSDYTYVSNIPEELIPYAIAVGDECILTPRSDLTELWGHVGPGRNRSVLTFLDLDATYMPISETVIEGEVWYEIQGDSQTLWVSAGDFEADCASQVGAQFERAPQCALVPREGLAQLSAYIGPGYNRSVRTFLDLNATYTPINQQEVEGVMWYQVTTENFGDLWISGDDLTNSCEVASTGTTTVAPAPNATAAPQPTHDPSLPTLEATPTFAATIATEEATFTEEAIFTEEFVPPTPEPLPTETPPPPPPQYGCLIEVGTGLFEQTPSSVLNGANGGNFVWENPSRLINTYSYWLIWENGIWSTGYYNDCSPLGYGASAPPEVNVIN